MNDIKKAIQSDGSLYLNSGCWIYWNVNDNEITLDADFTIEQLEFIIAHMKSIMKNGEQHAQLSK